MEDFCLLIEEKIFLQSKSIRAKFFLSHSASEGKHLSKDNSCGELAQIPRQMGSINLLTNAFPKRIEKKSPTERAGLVCFFLVQKSACSKGSLRFFKRGDFMHAAMDSGKACI